MSRSVCVSRYSERGCRHVNSIPRLFDAFVDAFGSAQHALVGCTCGIEHSNDVKCVLPKDSSSPGKTYFSSACNTTKILRTYSTIGRPRYRGAKEDSKGIASGALVSSCRVGTLRDSHINVCHYAGFQAAMQFLLLSNCCCRKAKHCV